MRIIEIRPTYMEMTDAIQGYVEERIGSLAKLCEKYNPCEIAVEVGKTSQHHEKGNVWRAEFTMTIPGETLRAEVTKDDLYAAIDEAKDTLKRQLIDRKER